MLSESINSYCLDKAYSSVGVETPIRDLSSKNSSKSSALSSPVKKDIQIIIVKETIKKPIENKKTKAPVVTKPVP